jgi:hypothetical protein
MHGSEGTDKERESDRKKIGRDGGGIGTVGLMVTVLTV